MERNGGIHPEVDSVVEKTIRIGQRFFGVFSQEAKKSNIPSEFFHAVQNYRMGTASRSKQEIKFRDVACDLLGVDCRSEDDAGYLVSLANMFSMVKQLQLGNLDPEQRNEIRLNAELMLGIAMISGFPRFFRKEIMSNILLELRAKPRIKRLTELMWQAEKNVGIGMYQNRIKLLSIGRGV